MNCNVLIAGVGGQGVISIGAIIAESAIRSGLHAAQSEVHGMSQRGGAVISHLRISRRPIESGTIGLGRADLLIAMEPLESLRHLDFLSAGGRVLVSENPIRNIGEYPEIEDLLQAIGRLPNVTVIDAAGAARAAGSAKAANVVMIGAASSYLPVPAAVIREVILEWSRAKGEKMAQANLDAFARGQEAVRCKAA